MLHNGPATENGMPFAAHTQLPKNKANETMYIGPKRSAGINDGMTKTVSARKVKYSGQMRNARIASVAKQRLRRRVIGQVELDTPHAGARQLISPRPLQRDVVIRIEVVDADDVGAVARQPQREMHADKSGRASHQRRHRRSAGRSSPRSLAYLQKLVKQPIAIWTRPAEPSRKPARSR